MSVVVTGSQIAVRAPHHTFVRSVPALFQLALPLTGWTITCPAPATDELMLAEKPGARASVKRLYPGNLPAGASEAAWLEVWHALDGLLLIPFAHPETETLVTSPDGHSILDRRLRKRARDNPAKLLPDVAWQLVTARPQSDGCLFFVFLASWGVAPIEKANVDILMNCADRFSLR